MEKICTAVPYPMVGVPGITLMWGPVCSDHPTLMGSNVPTDPDRDTAEAFAEALACAHPDHFVPGTEAEWRLVDPVTGERHLFTSDGRNLSVWVGAPDPGAFPPESAVNAVIVAAMLEHRYDPRYDDLKCAQWCDMTPVVKRWHVGPTDSGLCPDHVWVIEVQYSSKGGRAVYGIDRNNVPQCYMD
jgi:hypothetical protein